MTKLSKGLILVGGGVPAAGILTVCFMNMNPTLPHTELAAHTIKPPKPSTSTSTAYAMVQPQSLIMPATAGGQTVAADYAAPQGTGAETAPAPLAGASQTTPPGSPGTSAIPDPLAGASLPAQGTGMPTALAPQTGVPLAAQGARTQTIPDPLASFPQATPPATQTGTAQPLQGAGTTRPQASPVPVRTERTPPTPTQGVGYTPTRGVGLIPTTGQPARDTKTTAPQATPITKIDEAQKTPAAKAVAYARAQLGKPYVYGAEGPNSFDCSGLVQAAYKSAGIEIPRTSEGQYWFSKRVKPGQERPGDLVYFRYTLGSGGPGHVGIVLNPEKGLMIAAPRTGDHVKIQSYKNYPGGPAGFNRPTAGKSGLFHVNGTKG